MSRDCPKGGPEMSDVFFVLISAALLLGEALALRKFNAD